VRSRAGFDTATVRILVSLGDAANR
jgi:hypothetical protein